MALGVEDEAYGVADARSVDGLKGTGGGVGEDVGAVVLDGCSVSVGDVVVGADADEEAWGGFGGEDEGAGDVVAVPGRSVMRVVGGAEAAVSPRA